MVRHGRFLYSLGGAWEADARIVYGISQSREDECKCVRDGVEKLSVVKEAMELPMPLHGHSAVSYGYAIAQHTSLFLQFLFFFLLFAYLLFFFLLFVLLLFPLSLFFLPCLSVVLSPFLLTSPDCVCVPLDTFSDNIYLFGGCSRPLRAPSLGEPADNSNAEFVSTFCPPGRSSSFSALAEEASHMTESYLSGLLICDVPRQHVTLHARGGAGIGLGELGLVQLLLALLPTVLDCRAAEVANECAD